MESGQNVKWLQLIVVNMKNGDKWSKWKLAKMESGQNGKSFKMESGENRSDQKEKWWQVVKITSCKNEKL